MFLGLDHNYHDGPPLLFETMTFGGRLDQEWQERYATREQALLGHERICKLVRAVEAARRRGDSSEIHDEASGTTKFEGSGPDEAYERS